MEQPIRIETSGSVEQDDYVRALRWFAFTRRRWFFVLNWALIVGGGFVLWWVFSTTPRRGGSTHGVAIAVMLAIVLLVVVASQWLSIRLAAKRQYNSTPGVASPTRYVFDDEGMSVENSAASARQSWENIYQAHEADTVFILLRSRVLMLIIPKRLFRDEAQLAELRALLRRHLGNKAKLKPQR